MSHAIVRRSRRVRGRRSELAARGIEEPFPVQRWSSRTRSPATTCSPSRRPDRARRSPSASPLVERLTTPTRGRRRWSSRPTRELASRSSTSCARRARPRAVDRRRLRRRRLRQAGAARRTRAHPGRHARPARGPDRAPRRLARPGPRARPRRGRPDARHGLPPGRRPDRRTLTRADRQTLFFSATLEGEVGRARRGLHRQPAPPRARALGRAQRGDVEHRFVARSPTSGKLDAPGRRAERRRARPDARLRPHQARRRPAGQAPRGQRVEPSRCTATSPSASASARSPASSAARSTRSSPPTSPPAGIDVDEHHARHQLRRSRRPRRLRAPRRAHRPRRGNRRRRHPRGPRSGTRAGRHGGRPRAASRASAWRPAEPCRGRQWSCAPGREKRPRFSERPRRPSPGRRKRSRRPATGRKERPLGATQAALSAAAEQRRAR